MDKSKSSAVFTFSGLSIRKCAKCGVPTIETDGACWTCKKNEDKEKGEKKS